MKNNIRYTDSSYEKTAVKVSFINIICNALLSVFKMLAGLISHSGALIADAVNSISDVASSVIVIIGVKLSFKKSDKKHPYGHERFECVATILLAVILVITALFICHDSIESFRTKNSENIIIPGSFALAVAAFSIALKGGMFGFTRHYAKKLGSTSLSGIAWDNLSDVFSSFCVLASIVGARAGMPVLDVIASIVVSFFILKAAYEIFMDAIRKMVDRSCPDEIQEKMLECASKQDGVISADSIKTRVFGSKIYVEITVSANPDSPLSLTHAIALRIHDAIEQQFLDVKHIMVYVQPANSYGI